MNTETGEVRQMTEEQMKALSVLARRFAEGKCGITQTVVAADAYDVNALSGQWKRKLKRSGR